MTDTRVPATSSAGYSLIEILVALAIMSLAVSIVVPNAFDLVTRFQRLTERSAALDSIRNCRLAAVTSNTVITLGEPAAALDQPRTEVTCLALPKDWQAEFDEALVFSPAGICRGSRVELIAPDGQTTAYQLERETCRLSPVAT